MQFPFVPPGHMNSLRAPVKLSKHSLIPLGQEIFGVVSIQNPESAGSWICNTRSPMVFDVVIPQRAAAGSALPTFIPLKLRTIAGTLEHR